jgi:SAM-dependent methyltransferase
VNRLDQWVCRSGGWQKFLEGQLLPWVLKDVELRRDLLEIGPGPGLTTDLLRSRVERLTTIEIDPGFAEPLKQRMDGTNVTVVQGDAAKMPFESGSFSALVCFTMLHHVPSPALQDCLLQEACRVLKPGGIFVGTDSIWSVPLWLFHLGDTLVAVNPRTLPARLEAAGFADVHIEAKRTRFRFSARRPD